MTYRRATMKRARRAAPATPMDLMFHVAPPSRPAPAVDLPLGLPGPDPLGSAGATRRRRGRGRR